MNEKNEDLEKLDFEKLTSCLDEDIYDFLINYFSEEEEDK